MRSNACGVCQSLWPAEPSPGGPCGAACDGGLSLSSDECNPLDRLCVCVAMTEVRSTPHHWLAPGCLFLPHEISLQLSQLLLQLPVSVRESSVSEKVGRDSH